MERNYKPCLPQRGRGRWGEEGCRVLAACRRAGGDRAGMVCGCRRPSPSPPATPVAPLTRVPGLRDTWERRFKILLQHNPLPRLPQRLTQTQVNKKSWWGDWTRHKPQARQREPCKLAVVVERTLRFSPEASVWEIKRGSFRLHSVHQPRRGRKGNGSTNYR